MKFSEIEIKQYIRFLSLIDFLSKSTYIIKLTFELSSKGDSGVLE